MNQLSFIQKCLQRLKKADYIKFKKYLLFLTERNAKTYNSLCEQIMKLPQVEQLSVQEQEIWSEPAQYRKLYELRRHLDKYMRSEILQDEDHVQVLKQLQYIRYLREQGMDENYLEMLEEHFQQIETYLKKGHLRTIITDYLNELRKYYFFKFYKEKNYKPSSIAENYQRLEPAMHLIEIQHIQDAIFFDFTHKAAHKIESETLQKEMRKGFEPKYYSPLKYLEMLEEERLPLLHKTLILDIVEGSDLNQPELYINSIHKLMDMHFEQASGQEKYNLLVVLIQSKLVPSDYKDKYYEALVDLKSSLNPGVLHSYVIEHLAQNSEKARSEFERLKERAIHESENDLKAIQGILLTRENAFLEALKSLNQVVIYQQDKMYFEVNLCLLKCYYELGDTDIAGSILQKLNVYYYKYKDSLSPEVEESYRLQIAEFKKLL